MSGAMSASRELTDDMVRLAAEGAEAERARVCELMQPRVSLMVAARLRPTRAQLDAADDIAQDVMLALAKNISNLEDRTVRGLYRFVSGIVGNKVSDWIKQVGDNREPVRSLDSCAKGSSSRAALWELIPGDGTSPSSFAVRNERIAEIMSELEEMDARYRQIITLAMIDGLRTREIGPVMGITRPNAAVLLRRALRALRKTIGDGSTTDRGHDCAD